MPQAALNKVLVIPKYYSIKETYKKSLTYVHERID